MEKSLFIVGMPRSGTKLFRDLCNQHSQINIPEFETHFFPALIRKLGPKVESSSLTPTELLNFIESTTFYYNMKSNNYQISVDDIQKNCDLADWGSILSFILRHFAPKDSKNYKYFGDKTPNYIYHLPKLKKIFPEAKFVVMVRDPRDNSLSLKKTFNKNLFRAAINWRDGMNKVLSDIKKFKENVLFVKYENLISNPEQTMRGFCSFANLQFEEAMLSLSKPTETVGLTKGKTHIVNNNFNKYKKELSTSKIERIEELCYDMLIKWYSADIAQSYKKVSKFCLITLKIKDGVNSWRHHISEKNLIRGTWYFVKLHKVKER